MKAITRALLAATTVLGLSSAPVMADDAVTIGLVTSLTGPLAYAGRDIQDGFQLAIDLEGGKLGGLPVNLIVEDDGMQPSQGKAAVDRLILNPDVKIVTGILLSNVSLAAVPDVLDSGRIYVSSNAGPSNFAGAQCEANYYVASWQNDSLHEAVGQYATELGFKRVFIIVPNYQAGKDAVAGFKRFYHGEIVGEIYTRLDQTDFSAELAQIKAAAPDGVYQFHPGGQGIAFIRQYEQAGLTKTIPMVVAAASMDSATIAAVGDAAEGVNVANHWNSDFDNAANKTFMDAWTKAYGRAPTFSAEQSYTAALAIAAALKESGGASDTEAFRAAMLKADFASPRGSFAFGTNQHPVQNWYALKVERAADGTLHHVTKGVLLKDHGDVYAENCKL